MLTPELARASILIVDDEASNVELLEMLLADEGYTRVTSTRDPREVERLFDRVKPDLVLLDLHMPHEDGFGVMRRLRAHLASGDFVPILVLTADVADEAKLRALSEGAKDFLTKPLDAVEVGLRIRNLLETRLLYLGQKAARARAEAGEHRARFLSDASRILAGSFDHHSALATLARATVPTLADYCVIDLQEPDGSLVRVGAAHRDPAREALLREGTGLWAGAIPRGHALLQARTEGQFVLVSDLNPEMLDTPGMDPAERAALQELAPRSLVCAPVVIAGRVVGALGMAAAESGRSFGSDELALAEELARRAALAIENAQLFRGAQEAMRARDQVLAVVAHDLRNPIGTIRMAAELLLESAADGQRRHLEIVHRSSERMNALIQDLLEVTRIETGNLRLTLREERVAPLVEEALAMLRPLAGARGVALEKEVAPGLPPVSMDSARVLQVLSNLVGNAIKFTPERGRIVLRCEAGEGEVRFAVADTGPGISPEQLPHVFGRFWQASGADRRGIGLGLSIARGIVEGHRGRIWVESTLGDGATFYFTLPVADAAEQTVSGGEERGGVPQASVATTGG